ncbi:hypothetical protein SAMN05192552_1007118 [Natrinema hispanicum]|uniref:Uncharacterized protein n=1 Tax=Natrinema hispanicum TaxID=392421 RepID=A0A1G6PFW3_9EURY|nr:hypothetical protein SAMN05192552_1007118 [Natrinema hispanicum]SET61997.1 hypothetical protein SAMN04488694_10990 [Natrinema hispanicum]
MYEPVRARGSKAGRDGTELDSGIDSVDVASAIATEHATDE